MNLKSRYDGIIFDIDGTLTSTNNLIYASFNYITEKYMGKTLKQEEIIGLFGPTEEQIIEKWFPDNSEEVIEDYYEFYAGHHPEMVSLYPGIMDLLLEIKSQSITLGAFTGKGRRAATLTMEAEGIRQLFDMLISGDDVVNHKPHHEGIDKFLAEYNFTKNRVVMIGDAPADITASENAGVEIISVVWDSYAEEKVRSLNPKNLAHSVEELRNRLYGL